MPLILTIVILKIISGYRDLKSAGIRNSNIFLMQTFFFNKFQSYIITCIKFYNCWQFLFFYFWISHFLRIIIFCYLLTVETEKDQVSRSWFQWFFALLMWVGRSLRLRAIERVRLLHYAAHNGELFFHTCWKSLIIQKFK